MMEQNQPVTVVLTGTTQRGTIGLPRSGSGGSVPGQATKSHAGTMEELTQRESCARDVRILVDEPSGLDQWFFGCPTSRERQRIVKG